MFTISQSTVHQYTVVCFSIYKWCKDTKKFNKRASHIMTNKPDEYQTDFLTRMYVHILPNLSLKRLIHTGPLI